MATRTESELYRDLANANWRLAAMEQDRGNFDAAAVCEHRAEAYHSKAALALKVERTMANARTELVWAALFALALTILFGFGFGWPATAP